MNSWNLYTHNFHLKIKINYYILNQRGSKAPAMLDFIADSFIPLEVASSLEAVKAKFAKDSGVFALHFLPSETTPEQVAQMTSKLATTRVVFVNEATIVKALAPTIGEIDTSKHTLLMFL